LLEQQTRRKRRAIGDALSTRAEVIEQLDTELMRRRRLRPEGVPIEYFEHDDPLRVFVSYLLTWLRAQ
jgi:hypothetical protein